MFLTKYKYTRLQKTYVYTVLFSFTIIPLSFWLGGLDLTVALYLLSAFILSYIGFIKQQAIGHISPKSGGRSKRVVYGKDAVRATVGYLVTEVMIVVILIAVFAGK